MSLCVALLAAALAAPAEPAAEPFEALLSRADALYARRDEPGARADLEKLLGEAARRAPADYGVLWRRAQLQFWISDDPLLPAEEKSKLGQACWEVADEAARAQPGKVEGWFYAAGCMGNYALGIGVLKALTQGIEGKFKERLAKAEALDAAFQSGAIATAWGRFYYELPWPKYDAARSEQRLRDALGRNPRNVRALVYLAELFRKEGKPEEAGRLLESAVARPPGAYDAPEERRWQARARALLAQKP
ncbi:MAG: hypothetical protein HZB56_21450 [Deltaproteobacteria bacterium]|nr:hypothetical protein [Deltaproteobacteria bacterium]